MKENILNLSIFVKRGRIVGGNRYVIIGVANNPQSCKNWERVYGEVPLTYGRHKVVGITKEATTHFFDEGRYELKFGELVKNSLISGPLKEFVLANYRMVEFKGKVLLLVPAIKQDSVSYYDGKYYVREGTRTFHKKEMDSIPDKSEQIH